MKTIEVTTQVTTRLNVKVTCVTLDEKLDSFTTKVYVWVPTLDGMSEVRFGPLTVIVDESADIDT